MGYIVTYILRKIINIEPKVGKQGQTLVISSSWRAHLLSLGAASRKITVDPAKKVLRIKGRRFWFFGWSRRIEFDWIQEIIYGYWSTGGAGGDGLWSGSSGGGFGWYGEYTEDEMFTVALQLKNNTKVLLCRFVGSGDFVNNTIWPDWCYWGDQLLANATRGSQETNSQALADVLSHLIGVPITNPDHTV